MKVLVTGGCGYIGSHTCCELIKSGFDAVIIDNLANSEREVVDKLKRITGRDIKFYEADVCDKDTLSNIFIENDISAVIHFASLKDASKSIEDPLKYYKNNLDSTLTLLEVMREFDCKKLIFSSSAEIYESPERPLPITEDYPLETTTPLVNSKLMIETILKDIYEADNSWSIALLRYFNPIGAHKSGLLGEEQEGPSCNIMPSILNVLTGEQEELEIYGGDYNTPDGTCIRDYIHILDLARGHIKAVEKVLSTKEIDCYNLGTGKGYSVLDLIRIFERVNNVTIKHKIVDRRNGDAPIRIADTAYATRKLGFNPEYDIEEMCKDSYNYIKNRIEKE